MYSICWAHAPLSSAGIYLFIYIYIIYIIIYILWRHLSPPWDETGYTEAAVSSGPHQHFFHVSKQERPDFQSCLPLATSTDYTAAWGCPSPGSQATSAKSTTRAICIPKLRPQVHAFQLLGLKPICCWTQIKLSINKNIKQRNPELKIITRLWDFFSPALSNELTKQWFKILCMYITLKIYLVSWSPDSETHKALRIPHIVLITVLGVFSSPSHPPDKTQLQSCKSWLWARGWRPLVDQRKGSQQGTAARAGDGARWARRAHHQHTSITWRSGRSCWPLQDLQCFGDSWVQRFLKTIRGKR